MGVVYEARDPLLDRTVALKVIQPAVAAEERLAFEERFLAEARIAAALQHPGIVVVHDSGRDETTGALFIALELLRGETLADVASEGPAPWPRVMHVVSQVARALEHAHRAGVVHRDIKPANVIVLPTGEAKVTDFGIARLESARQRLTTTGEFIGTPLYTAPEQARVEDVDGRADVFSLASVAYTLLAGRPPFLAPSIPGIVHRVVYEEPDPLSSLVPDLPKDVERVLGRALAKEPDARYPTAEAFAEDAEDLLAGVPPRHAGGDDLVVVEDEDPTRTVKLGAGAGTPRPRRPAPPSPDAGRHPAPPLEELAAVSDTRTALPPPRTHTPRPSRARLLGGVAVVLGLVALLLWMPRPASTPAPSTRRAASPGAAVPPASAPDAPSPVAPGPGAAAPWSSLVEPARLRIDLDHPLRRGRIRVFVDDTLTLDERISGQERKKALVFKLHEGTFRDELDIAPGLHEVRLEIAWDDNRKVERIVGSFRSGATRTLDASLGRIRRDLSLEWK
jgi:serine/threonine-protein kinase